MTDVSGLPVDRMAIHCAHDRDACIGPWCGLRPLRGLSVAKRQHGTDDKCGSKNPDPTMLHLLLLECLLLHAWRLIVTTEGRRFTTQIRSSAPFLLVLLAKWFQA